MMEVGEQIKQLELNKAALDAVGADTTRQAELIADRKRELTLQSRRYKQMVEKLTRELSDVNITSLAYINKELPSIYRVNYNQKPAGLGGVRFNIVDEATVRRMIEKGDIQLPKKKIDIPKDMRWNTRQLNSSVLQGIMNGESMQKIAKRIFPITNRNEASAIRNARTMVTGAENGGRVDRYKELESRGMILAKTWIATSDERTREWHLSMDGQTVGIHEMFVDGNGNELAYPADPNAAPETVWNCRCSMSSKIIGFRKGDRIIYV